MGFGRITKKTITRMNRSEKIKGQVKRRWKKTEAQRKTVIPRIERPVTSIGAIPNKLRRKMIYTLQSQMVSTTGTKSFDTFRINSIYYNQPMGFDQLATLYTKYVVHNAKITVRAVNDTTGYPCFVGLRLDDDTTATATTLDAQIQQDYPYVKLLTANTNGHVTISRTWSAKKAFNVKQVNDNHSLEGTFTSDPSWLNYAKVWVHCPSTYTSASITYWVTIIFDVEISNPKELNSS